MIRRIRHSFVAAIGLLYLFSTVVSLPRATAATNGPYPRSISRDVIFYTVSNDESVVEGLTREALSNSRSGITVGHLTEKWLDRLSSGKTVPGLGGSAATQRAGLTKLDAITRRPAARITIASATPGPALNPTPQASGLDPNAFVVRGTAAGTDRSYWNNLKLAVGAGRCDKTGCEETDRFDINVTVNPGALTSKITSLGVLSKDSGRFQNAHLEIWALNKGINVGLEDTGSVYGRKTNFLSSTRRLNNTVLTIAVALWVFDLEAERYGHSAGKTADASCRAPGDNRCFY